MSTPGDAATTTNTPAPKPPAKKSRGVLFWGCLIVALLGIVITATAAITAWWIKSQIDPAAITPVELTQVEEKALEEKVDILREQVDGSATDGKPVRRPVSITARELNALIAKNTGLADKVKIELSDDNLLARANIPIPDDFPGIGGKTARLRVALETRLIEQTLSVRVSEVSIGGFPLPNAWLGGLKDIDLVEHYANSGPLKALVAGIEEFDISEDAITLTPAE